MPERRIIGYRQFSLKDQYNFAVCSGDFNPIHIDPLYARRSVAGAPVVHGMHLLLWALEAASEQGITVGSPERLHAQFLRPALIDLPLACSLEPEEEGTDLVLLISSAEGQELARLELKPGVRAGTPTNPGTLPHQKHTMELPVCRRWEELRSLEGSVTLGFAGDMHVQAWPGACGDCGVDFMALLAGTSQLVGMQCPGLNSLYYELLLHRSADAGVPPGILRYEVAGTDARFKLVDIAVHASPYVGKIRAFVRPEPIAHAAMSSILARAPIGSRRGQRALVVGGSRGIGEVAAKVLAACGADVCLTYAVGHDDAETVIADIRATGATAFCAQLDVLADCGQCKLIMETFRPTHLFYCATPYIFAGRREQFSSSLLTRFRRFYVSGFERLLRFAYSHGLRYAWYPSSLALEEQPEDMREYCIAKAEGEALATALKRELPGLNIDCPRLPRTASDQTNGIVAIANADPVAVFLSSLPKTH